MNESINIVDEFAVSLGTTRCCNTGRETGKRSPFGFDFFIKMFHAWFNALRRRLNALGCTAGVLEIENSRTEASKSSNYSKEYTDRRGGVSGGWILIEGNGTFHSFLGKS